MPPQRLWDISFGGPLERQGDSHHFSWSREFELEFEHTWRMKMLKRASVTVGGTLGRFPTY